MQDLNSLIAPASGLILVQAWDINDSGQITGLAFSGNQGRAFLLTPIAPSSYTVTIIPRIQVGNAVNDRGQVAGTLGVPELGTTLSFLALGLTPIMLCAKLSVQRAGRAR
jgi:hypothetical protein